MTAPSPSPDERVSIGTVLDGRYRIDAVLGSGGMGRVYRGEHTGIGRAVAIKVLHADLNRNREAAQRFQREALASGRLDHPNIVGVSDFGVLDDGACYLVMEALEGESLGDRLARDKRIHWREALTILRGVLAGLRHAHDRGVVHRDIKPDNIFLALKDGEPVVKILDFGIAKLYAGSPDDPASTRAGLTVGTPAYLSPEQAVGGEIKPASDIYSATIVLFEMLTGRAPFEDKDPLAMLGAHVSRTPPSITEVAPDLAGELPGGIEDMVQRGLMKIAGERIASATDYIAWIDAVVSAATPTGSAPIGVPTIDSRPIATPPPGTVSPLASIGHAATLGALTPVPESFESSPSLPISSPSPSPSGEVERKIRAVSLAELGAAPPVPRSWVIRGAIVLGAIVVLVIILAIAKCGGGGDKDAPSKDKKVETKPAPAAAPKPAPPPPPKTVPKDDPPPDDDKTKLNALLYELDKGKDCKTRRAVLPKIVELGDPAAIPALKRAKNRMAGGVLGFGQENINRCMSGDLDNAIKQLTKD